MSLSLILSFICLLAWGYLTLLHGKFWEPLLPKEAPTPATWPSVDIIIPARDEADILPAALPSLLAQDYPGTWRVLLVDDHSTDGTASVATSLAAAHPGKLTVISAPALPEGWGGKVAAMQAGVAQSTSDYILFTDADIRHTPTSLRFLVARAVQGKLDLTSRMVRLQTIHLAEKFLIPAFVFFFAMLYPFRMANHARSNVAAAAGGVMLVRKKALQNAGGLEQIKGALIDDCALARLLKDHGGDNEALGRIELTLTNNIYSLRPYPRVGDIVHMIARTAFTQLNYSPILLLGTVLGMMLLFWLPIAFPLTVGWEAGALAYLAWLLMTALYIPMVRFYGLSWVWALTLPAAAGVYIWATLKSAWRTWQGHGGQWKGRAQA